MSETIFLLNGEMTSASEADGLLVLDYLRKTRRLTGTKEGCKEGDCGACGVLIGECENDRLRYRSITSCLMPLGELHGKHLVTIEGLNLDELTPVQQAIYDAGGSQCGFCTPGIVVSLTGYLIENGAAVDYSGMKQALSGHLCRCTGYCSLKRAAQNIVDLVKKWAEEDRRLASPKQIIEALVDYKVVPDYFRNVVDHLCKIEKKTSVENEEGMIIAGGTDIYVQKGDDLAVSAVTLLGLHPQLKGIERKNGSMCIGALTTFEEFGQNGEIRQIIPKIKDYMELIASLQIRNRATFGGNIVNASPIADITILLLALQAELTLVDENKERILPLCDLYLDYKKLAKKPQEIVREITFAVPDSQDRINFEKVSKRRCLDIASVNSAAKIRYVDGIIENIAIAIGGVAPVPLLLKKSIIAVKGKTLSKEVIDSFLDAMQEEIAPIDDVRGSAKYKKLLARQLVLAHFCRLFSEKVKARDLS